MGIGPEREETIMKKIMSLILCIALAIGCITACGSSPSGSSAPASEAASSEAASSANEDVVLKVAAFEGGYGVTYWEKICADFEKAYGCKVELVASPTIDDIVRPQMIAGEYPDILYLDDSGSALFHQMVKEEAFVDLKDVFDGPTIDGSGKLGDLIVDGLLESSGFSPYGDSRVIKAPISSNALCLVYNKALFAENGWEFPKTWDELFKLGDAAKEKGYALFTYPGIYASYNAPLIFGSIGSALGVDALKKLEQYNSEPLKTDEAKQIFEYVAKIGTGGYLMEGTTGLNHTQAQAEFLLNKALIVPCGDWLPAEMADSPIAEGWEWAAAPSFILKDGETPYFQMICDGFTIPKAAKNQDLAKEFVRFFYTDAAQKYMCECGITTCTKNFYKVAGDMLPPESLAFLEIRNQAASYTFTYDTVDTKLSMENAMWDPYTSVMNGELSAEDWLASLIDTMDRIAAGE